MKCQLLLHTFLPSARVILNTSFQKQRGTQQAFQQVHTLHMAGFSIWVLLHAGPEEPSAALVWQWQRATHGSNPLTICAFLCLR